VHVLEPLPTVLLGSTLHALAGLAPGAAPTTSAGSARVIRGSTPGAQAEWGAGDSATDVAARLDELTVAASGSSD
jgi:hypothetical protein